MSRRVDGLLTDPFAQLKPANVTIEVAKQIFSGSLHDPVKSAVETGELDAQIEQASGSLKAGFKK